ncbi:MAG: class I SAM-dependent methyltransferase, partial [Spirochaetota bacterium]
MKTTENMAQIAIRARVGIHASRKLAYPCATHGSRQLCHPVARMKGIEAHFDSEAKKFDRLIKTMVPGYDAMINAAVGSLPFPRSRAIRVVDLGTGTGTLASRVSTAYPKAQITCVDMAQSMLAMAKRKLPRARFHRSDFYRYEFDGTYDAVVSSLALHHLVTDTDKHAFYRKIFRALKRGGVFVNADVIFGATKHIQAAALGQWRTFMEKRSSPREIKTTFANFRREDSPATIRS